MTDDVDVEQLIAHATKVFDPRWWTRGRVVRTIRASARLVHETFWLDLEADRHPYSPTIESRIAARDGEVVVGEQSFHDEPPLGPITLWVRDIDARGADAADQMAGNLSPVEDPIVGAPLEFIDATHVEPVADAVVWRWLDQLDGKSTFGAIDHVAVRLAREDETTILGVAQALMRLMQSLDAPDLKGVWVDDEGRSHAPPLLSRWRRGAVLAGGRAVYEAAVRDGADAQHRAISDGSPLVPNLAAIALSKHLRREVHITTTWMPQDGSNRDTWGDLLAGDPPYRPPADVVGQLAEHQRRIRDVWKEATGQDLGDEPRTFFTIRYAVIDTGGAREIVQFVYGDPRMPLVAAEKAATETAARLGGEWIGPIEMHDPHTARPMTGEVFTIKRRFTGGLEAYRQRYGI